MSIEWIAVEPVGAHLGGGADPQQTVRGKEDKRKKWRACTRRQARQRKRADASPASACVWLLNLQKPTLDVHRGPTFTRYRSQRFFSTNSASN